LELLAKRWKSAKYQSSVESQKKGETETPADTLISWLRELSWRQQFIRYIWLSYFFVTVDSSEFHQNYMNAWKSSLESPSKLKIFLGSQYLDMPLPLNNADDSVVFACIRLFYNCLKLRRGVLEIFVPKKLVRIECVEVREGLSILFLVALLTSH
jgi:hypothetical protein